MTPEITFSEGDTGKEVVTAAGDIVGTVTEAHGDSAMVDPSDDADAELLDDLGWDAADTGPHLLDADQVSGITDDAVQVGGTTLSQ
jgi:hypothetical protein